MITEYIQINDKDGAFHDHKYNCYGMVIGIYSVIIWVSSCFTCVSSIFDDLVVN